MDIKVENIAKKYCKSLKRSMLYGITDITKNIFGLSSGSEKLRKDEFWALNNISFEVKKGEVFGIIGANGSGKTTLLKLLNGIFWPDKGKITIKGRVSALIEVGAGFHPELTGRENIYVNAAILGMTKEAVNENFDEIIKFADIGEFINTPVKFYSSGMYVRLGFAIAIYCQPDILLVDEILAVGDRNFQSKCYQVMNEIRKKKNMTMVFVSHNLLTIERFCDKGLWIDKGEIKSQGEIHKVIYDYQKKYTQLLEKPKEFSNIDFGMPTGTKEVKITNVECIDKEKKKREIFAHEDKFGIKIEYCAKKHISNIIFQISLSNIEGTHIATFGSHFDHIPIEYKENGVIECWIDKLPLLLNKYYLSMGVYDETHNILFDYWNGSVLNEYFQVLPNQISTKMADYTAICHFKTQWNINGKIYEK